MDFDLALITGVAAAALRLAMAIGFAALGELVAQRAGVINVGIEGIMLCGALAAALGAVWSGSPWLGLLSAIAVGVALGAVHALFTITLRADQIVCGIALVILGMGLSGYGNRLTLGRTPASVPTLGAVDLGELGGIPVLGSALFAQNPLVYIAFALAIALAWMLRRTALGLAIRASGENPAAADAAGIRVNRTRFGCVLFGGALAGLGGGYLVIAQVGAFVENMVVGRGFIAIACVVFGRWHPLGALAAALGFGLAEAAQIRLQTFYPGVPYQFFVMLPYVAAIVALVFLARGAALPKALGRPFWSEHR
jgi:simple sugar transport system permease protein